MSKYLAGAQAVQVEHMQWCCAAESEIPAADTSRGIEKWVMLVGLKGKEKIMNLQLMVTLFWFLTIMSSHHLN